jgi:hypothetical protein
MPTHRAGVLFRAKESGPTIEFQQGEGADILPDGLFLELRPGASFDEAQEIAAYLKEKIKGVLRITANKGGNDEGDTQKAVRH